MRLIKSFIPRFYISWKPLVGCAGFMVPTFNCLDTGTVLAGMLEIATWGIETVRATPPVFQIDSYFIAKQPAPVPHMPSRCAAY